MSDVPYGHNINASALPGGGGENAVINVMRGGGPENVSLLPEVGGSIVEIRGGGRFNIIRKAMADLRKSKKPATTELKKKKPDTTDLNKAYTEAKARANTAGEALKKLRAEKERPQLAPAQQTPAQLAPAQKTPVDEPFVLEQTKKLYQVELYEPVIPSDLLKGLTEFVTSFNPDLNDKIKAFNDRQTPKWQQYNKSGGKTSDITSKKTHLLVEVLPKTTETFIIIPPIKNNVVNYLTFLEYLYMNDIISDGEKLKANTVLIFMAPFFGKTEDPKLLYSVLHLQEKNPNSVFILRRKGAIDDTHTELSNPSHIILPVEVGRYNGFVFSHEDRVKDTKNTLAPSFLVDKVKSFSYNPGPDEDKGFKTYLNILSQSTFVPPTSKIIANQCQTLFTVFYSDHIIENDVLSSSDDNHIMIMRIIKKEEPPLICSDLDGDVYGIPSTEGLFKDSEDRSDFERSEIIDTYIQGRKQRFRNPAVNPKVIENWKSQLYSKGEADFLNYLNLSPSSLQTIFGSSWPSEVSVFLENMIKTKCFDDTTVSMVGECEETRKFLTKIYSYFLMNPVDDHMYEFEEKMDEPDVEFLGWPSELHEIANPITIHLKYLDLVPSNDKLHVDLIVIHKKLDRRNFMQLIIKKDPKITEYGPVIRTIIGELEKKYPEFLFIYS